MFQIQTFFYNKMQKWEQQTRNGFCCTDLSFMAFIREMGKNFGPKQVTDYNPRNTGTLFLFDGEVRDLASRFGDMGDYFDYFLNQNYFGKEPNHELYPCAKDIFEKTYEWH